MAGQPAMNVRPRLLGTVRSTLLCCALALALWGCGAAEGTSGESTIPQATQVLAAKTPGTSPPITVPLASNRARVVLDGSGCTASAIPERWSDRPLPIEIINGTTTRMALVMGIYQEGFDREDLVSYGRDISTRPSFIEALNIYEVGPGTTRDVSFDRGPGRYFMVCMDSTSTMVVLADLVVDG